MMTAEDDVAKALDELDRSGLRAHFAGAASEERVSQAEAALGVRFPPSYRRFLRERGLGSFGGEEVYGIGIASASFGAPSAVWITRTLRERDGLPSRYVVLDERDDSSVIALDTGLMRDDGEAPVVNVWPGETEPHVHVADSFGAFFLGRVRDAIAQSDA